MIKKDKVIFKQYLAYAYAPVYMQDWYLDVVCGADSWEVFLLIKNESILAFWITCSQSKLSVDYALNSPLTPYTGLYLVDESMTLEDLQPLITAVQEEHNFLEQDIHFSYTSVLSDIDQWKITYIIDSDNVDLAWANMKTDYRRKIRRAIDQLTIRQVDFAAFEKLLAKSFANKNQENPYPTELFQELDRTSSQNNSKYILGAFDSNDKLVGAAYFLIDQKYTYYLAGGSISEQNSMYLLIWSAVKESIAEGRIFDFEGSMIPGVAQFFRGFGGAKVEYPLYKYSSSWLVAKLVDLKKKLQ